MDTESKVRANHAARAGCKCKLQLLKRTDSNDVGAADRLEAAALAASCARAGRRRRRSGGDKALKFANQARAFCTTHDFYLCHSRAGHYVLHAVH